MGWLISWWCTLIGVSDPMAQSVAEGIVAAGILFAIVAVVLILVSARLSGEL